MAIGDRIMNGSATGAFAAAAALFAATGGVLAADMAIIERGPVIVDTSRVPACDDPRVHRKIEGRFAQRERQYWQSGLRLMGFAQVREVAYRPWGMEYIPRRFCEGRTLTNDGVDRPITYSVEEATGFAGIGFGVEWCVGGLDRHLAYAPDCKMAGP